MRIIDVLSILGIISAPIYIGFANSQVHSPQTIAATQQATIADSFPLNKSRLITFEPDEGFQRLSPRQQLDQLRDWLLLTAISRQGLSAKDINEAVYDLPPVRYSYMSPVANFEYGQTRSIYIGNGQVIAIVPQNSSSAERKDDLAHIADRHRKDLGKAPTSLLVFEYEISLDKQAAFLTRKENIDAQKLFSNEYGYLEAKINNLSDFQSFMSQVDDVTFAQMNDSTLSLGGRKLSNQKYQGIRVEDVAAIWQSEKKIQEQRTQFETHWQEKYKKASALERPKIQQQAQQESQKLKLVNGSGFSLDPNYDYPALKSSFEEIEFPLQSLISKNTQDITNQDIEKAKLGLAKNDILDFLTLAKKLAQSNIPELSRLGNELPRIAREKYSFQSARYDGDLKGTEVGMVLFYTDVLMKLWDFNHSNSALEAGIKDFKPETRIPISTIYKQELEELPSARLWLGPSDRGFQIVGEITNLIFARNATRIYAASSNPLKPGIEEPADASINNFLGWWNDHYEEVAQFEPQYQRLNEIMKWSLLISWLNQSGQGNQLSFLQNIVVKRDNWFSDWLKAQGDRLKFQNFEKIRFFERGYKGSNTETMPLIISESFYRYGKEYYFSGGVSLGNQKIFKDRVPLSQKTAMGELGKRSNLNYNSDALKAGKLTTLDETTYNLKNINRNLSETTIQAKAGTKFRNPDAEIVNPVFTQQVSQTPSGLKIDTAISGTDLGTFSVNKTRNGFKVGFSSRDIDTAHSIGLRLSKDSRPLSKALPDIEMVESVLISNRKPPEYFAKITDSKRWLKIEEAGGGGSLPPKPPNDSGFIVGDLGDDSRKFQFAWLDEKNVKSDDLKSVYSLNSERETPKIVQDLKDQKYKEIADGFIDNKISKIAFFEPKNKYLEIKLKQIDRLLTNGKDITASKQLDSLIQIYGPEPKLILRKAIAELRRGKLEIKRIDLAEDLMQSKSNFFDEINKRLENSNFNFRRFETDKAFIYTEDHPGLNNLDWNVPIEQSIPSGSGARVYEIFPGEIGGNKFYLSGFGDASASSHTSTQFQTSNTTNILRNIRYDVFFKSESDKSESDKCKEENRVDKYEENRVDKCQQEKPTYVVIMSNK